MSSTSSTRNTRSVTARASASARRNSGRAAVSFSACRNHFLRSSPPRVKSITALRGWGMVSMMRIFALVSVGAVSAGAALLVSSDVTTSAPLPAPSAQAVLERNFDASIDTDEMRGWLQRMSAEPNHDGSPHDKANAEWELAQFKKFGWDAHIETFEVLYPTPISESAELLGPEPYKLTLQERPIPGDSRASAKEPALPAYVAYQGDGDVTAPLVYVNYGMPDDYKTLKPMRLM